MQFCVNDVFVVTSQILLKKKNSLVLVPRESESVRAYLLGWYRQLFKTISKRHKKESIKVTDLMESKAEKVLGSGFVQEGEKSRH